MARDGDRSSPDYDYDCIMMKGKIETEDGRCGKLRMVVAVSCHVTSSQLFSYSRKRANVGC